MFYYVVNIGGSTTTVVESERELVIGDEVCIDFYREPKFGFVHSQFLMEGFSQQISVKCHTLWHSPELARNQKHRDEERMKIRRELDLMIATRKREAAYAAIAEIDPEANVLYQRYIELE